MTSKNTICLWFDGTALAAANFYAETFPDSARLTQSTERPATIPAASKAMSSRSSSPWPAFPASG